MLTFANTPFWIGYYETRPVIFIFVFNWFLPLKSYKGFILFKKQWTKSNPNESMIGSFCSNLHYFNNGTNAAVILDKCSNNLGIFNVTENFGFVCQKCKLLNLISFF